MKLVDLAFTINPNCIVKIIVHPNDPMEDSKVIGPTEFWHIGFGGYEVTDITVSSEGFLLLTCHDW